MRYQFTPSESQVNQVYRKNSGGKGPGAIFGEEEMEQFRKYCKSDQLFRLRSGKSSLRKQLTSLKFFTPLNCYGMRALLVLSLLILSPNLSSAEIYNCDGKWTNKPCDGSVSESIKEKTTDKAKADRKILSAKKSLLHELRMEAISAKRKYDVNVDLKKVEELCLKTETSVESCKKEIAATEDRITQKSSEKALVKAQEERNRLQEEANKLQKEKNEQESVVVVERPRRYHIRRDHPHYIGGHGSHNHQPHSGHSHSGHGHGHSSHSQGSVGVGINVQGSNGSIQVGGSIGESKTSTQSTSHELPPH